MKWTENKRILSRVLQFLDGAGIILYAIGLICILYASFGISAYAASLLPLSGFDAVMAEAGIGIIVLCFGANHMGRFMNVLSDRLDGS